MTSKVIAVVTTVLGVAAAVFAFLPYGWSHVASGAIAAALAALHPVNAAVMRVRKVPSAPAQER